MRYLKPLRALYVIQIKSYEKNSNLRKFSIQKFDKGTKSEIYWKKASDP